MNIQTNVNLAPFNTFRIDTIATHFITITHPHDLQSVLAQSIPQPLFILGGGSNILFTRPFEGTILYNQIKGVKVITEDQDHVWLQVGSGENWHQLVQYCISQQWGGIENLSLIPGTVGAAPIQNIGAYGVELCSVLQSLNAIDLSNGNTVRFDHDDCEFGYRDSIFKHTAKDQFFITDITLKLSKNPTFNLSYHTLAQHFHQHQLTASLSSIHQAVMDIRTSKLPNPDILPNAGSFFKNPVLNVEQYQCIKSQFDKLPNFQLNEQQYKVPAAWLIEQCGLKNARHQRTGTAKSQAVVIINYNNASGLEIANFAELIQNKVLKRFQIQLEAEVNIVR